MRSVSNAEFVKMFVESRRLEEVAEKMETALGYRPQLASISARASALRNLGVNLPRIGALQRGDPSVDVGNLNRIIEVAAQKAGVDLEEPIPEKPPKKNRLAGRNRK